MEAIVYTKFEQPDVLQMKEVEKPDPKDNEVLIKIYATTVTSGDPKLRASNLHPLYWLMRGITYGYLKPKLPILGSELAGEIESVGKNVTRFTEGDQVFGSTFGLGLGAYAEYKCLPENGLLAIKPANVPYEEAVGVPFMGLGALWFLGKGNIQQGQKVLIYGASGAVGTYAVQLAKSYGANVTGVCSTVNLEMVKSLGADKVIDYTKEDITRNGLNYDVIFDSVGKAPFSRCKKILKERGIYISVDVPSTILLMIWTSIFGSKKAITGVASNNNDELNFLKKLMEEGKLISVIDRTYPLEQIAEAHNYVEKGHKKGNVIITVEHNNKT